MGSIRVLGILLILLDPLQLLPKLLLHFLKLVHLSHLDFRDGLYALLLLLPHPLHCSLLCSFLLPRPLSQHIEVFPEALEQCGVLAIVRPLGQLVLQAGDEVGLVAEFAGLPLYLLVELLEDLAKLVLLLDH